MPHIAQAVRAWPSRRGVALGWRGGRRNELTALLVPVFGRLVVIAVALVVARFVIRLRVASEVEQAGAVPWSPNGESLRGHVGWLSPVFGRWPQRPHTCTKPTNFVGLVHILSVRGFAQVVTAGGGQLLISGDMALIPGFSRFYRGNTLSAR